MNGPPAFVLDASALLAYIKGEPGFQRVIEALEQGVAIGAVNWAETLSKLADLGLNPDTVVRELTDQGLLGQALVVHALDEAVALEIARLRPLTRAHGLSLGDCACLALARHLGAPVLTADRSWNRLTLGIKVETIR